MNVELVSLTLIGIDVFMQNQLQDEEDNSLILKDKNQKQKDYDKEGFRCTELQFKGIKFPDQKQFNIEKSASELSNNGKEILREEEQKFSSTSDI